MTTTSGKSPRPRQNRLIQDTYDEADWVDWDHWQTVEEMQGFLDGVNDRPEAADLSDMTEDGDGLVARQIRRYGLQADG